jgi:hypothetical protein
MNTKLISYKSLLILSAVILTSFIAVKFNTNVVSNSLSKLPFAKQENIKGAGCIFDDEKLSKEHIFKFKIGGGGIGDASNFNEGGVEQIIY